MSRKFIVAILALALALLVVLAGYLTFGEAAVVRGLFYASVLGFVLGLLWMFSPPD